MEIKINNINGTNFATASNVYDIYKKSGNKNDFELVLDGLILEIYSDNQDLKNYIKSLPKENKRLATLALLSDVTDDNPLWKQIKELVEKKQSSYERLKGVYNLIKEYVKIADVDRKGKGEIHTPYKKLAEPMVKLVEKYDAEFWKNKNHKVLDSSAGYGTFLILAAYKFMVGLKDVIEDEEERFKWIVENCLYYGELQARSVFSWLVAIDPFDHYKTNIFWGNFLSEDFDKHMKEVWKVEKFDLTIQNPPFQMRKEGFKKTQPLWHLFVQKLLTLLKEGGYMVMVHPSGWRNVDGVFKETQLMMLKNQILELNIQNEKEGIKLFRADTRFDFYILKKSPRYRHTEIKDQDNINYKIDNLSDMEFIPNGGFEEIKRLLAHESDEKVTTLHSYSSYETRKDWISRDKNEIFKYPVVYTVPKGDNLNLMYSSCNNKGHFGYPKLIWSNGRIISVGSVIDYNGEFGLTQFSYAIVDDVENLDNIKKAFDSPKFRKIMELSAVGDMSINRKVISLFKKDFWKEFV